jgi:uncharacterized protein (TIGR02145 family)
MKRITQLLLSMTVLVFINSCQEDTVPSVETNGIKDITVSTAVSGGIIFSDGEVSKYGVCWSTDPRPTVSDNKVYGKQITSGKFIVTMTTLLPNTAYFLRAFASSSAGTGYGKELSFRTQPSNGTEIKDADNNIYHTVNIGAQVWLAENLKTTKFLNGESLSQGTFNSSMSSYGVYNNNPANNVYGFLYNFKAVTDARKICPSEWHVPSMSEWEDLTDYLGTSAVRKLKESGVIHWGAGNVNASNESGFTALPGGKYGSSFSRYEDLGMYGYWWMSDSDIKYSVFYLEQNDESGYISFFNGDAFSVRCLRD